MKNEKKKREISRGRAINNNIYATKLLVKLCPSMVVHGAISRFLGYFEWLFYSAFFMRFVINSLQSGDSFGRIMIFVAIVTVVACAMSFYDKFLVGYRFPINNVIVNKELYKLLFKKSRNVELECFENSEFYDKYTLAMEKADTRLVETVHAVFNTIFGAIAGVCAFVFMFQVDKISVLFLIFPAIGNFVFNRMISHIDYDRNKDMNPHNRRIAYINRVMYLPEYAKEMRLTDVFSLMRRQYKEAITGLADVTKKYTKKAMVLHWLYVMFTFTFIFEGLLIYGAFCTLVRGSMSLAQLSVITSMMVSTTWILIGFTESLTSLFKNGLFIEYLRTFLEYKEKISENYEGIDPGTEIKTLEFRDVSFSYKDKKVLSHLNMEFRGGKTYALVGHNGAGKTTLIKLLLRLYDPTEGEILLNGRNIKEYDLKKYRALFATAFQDNRMFSMSVTDNVVMGENIPEAKKIERVEEALKLSGAYDKVMSLKHGMGTTLTNEFDDEGAVLSGGESQKVVVARAFVKQCPFKVFDEPSSALDPIAEATLFDNIYETCKDNTLVFISHRLSSVQNADWVYLLSDKTVKEEGTHRMLMEKHGLYADMYTKQAKNYLAISGGAC
ncbi:ABC transporter ATP-binding protein [Butyrivibrio sp. INlla14]|uniref:ABC transporter ATP-binding protein n=1 Tax=Butyrivibrio sp. INlla14 TaxID=1520808 RepID=UPI000876A021|nr:ABC transporter ATP-binding protein [Butyrivibrio sp. INlla14]SCY65668.1 ATP-binding cassette, subfamily B [Butyrivibrio sp. INlla14]